MKKLIGLALLTGIALLLTTPTALAQSAASDLPAPGTPPASAATTPTDPNRAARQQKMTPEEAARDQQLQILEARTGNTTFGVEKSGPYRQMDKAGNAFTVRKFKAMPGQEQKRGVSKRVVMGATPQGKPLVHNHGRKKRFLFF